MLKKILTTLLAITFLILLQPPAELRAAQNMSGIWSGEFDPSNKSHLTVNTTNSGLFKQKEVELSNFDMAGTLQKMINLKQENRQKSAPKLQQFKVKIYHVDNQVHLINLVEGTNPLVFFVDFADSFMSFIEGRKLPATSQAIDLQLSDQGISNHSSNSTTGFEGGAKFKIDTTSDTAILRNEKKDILLFKMTVVIKLMVTKDGKTITDTMNVKVTFPFKRAPLDPDVWTDEEIDDLLIGASKHHFKEMMRQEPPYSGPLGQVAVHIFRDSSEGYRRLFNYAANKYNLSTPKKFDIDLDSDKTGYLGGIEGVYANMYLCKKAYRYNVLYLASVYIHEYTHVVQFDNGQKFNKFERETEAHCIQKEWINNHDVLPDPLQYSKTRLVKNIDDNFEGNYGSPLQCNRGTNPRNWVRAKIHTLTQSSREISPFTKGAPAAAKPGQKKWQVIVE
jgi:hypothetical protein